MVHRCLLIPELFRLICERTVVLQPDGSSKGSKSSLVALATTCRAFQEPALDTLWFHMEDLWPLIKCMPQDMWDDSPYGLAPSGTRLLILRRAITASDLKRVFVYSTRILKLEFRPPYRDTLVRINATVFEAIMLATIGRKLLPNLLELSWNPDNDTCVFPYIHLFLGPKITSLKIALDCCTGTRLSLIHTLVNIYPEITHVELYSSWKDLHPAEVSDAVCQWNNLRVLSVENLNDGALFHIASLPYLRDLSFRWMVDPVAHRTKHEVGLPSLRKLSIITPRIENCISLIQLMTSCPLCELILEVCLKDRFNFSVALWKKLFEAMEKHCLPTTLNYVSITESLVTLPNHEDGSDDEVGDDIMQLEHFESLLHFPNVVHIDLQPLFGFSLTPDATRTIATSWRGIERLILGTKTASYAPPGITIDDLVPFARYCANLRYLGIIFDAQSVKKTLKKPGDGYSAVQLQSLHVGDSPITDSASVAAFLSDIFPNLSSMETADDELEDSLIADSGMCTKWVNVLRMVDLFTSVRIQERQFISK